MKKKKPRQFKAPYPAIMVAFAPIDRPMPEAPVRLYLAKIHSALERLRSDAGGSTHDWEDVGHCINFIEACRERDWLNEDAEPVIAEASRAMREVATYYREHGRIHLVAANLPPVIALLEDYEVMIAGMSARNYMTAFNAFCREIYDHTSGRAPSASITEVDFTA